MVQLCRLMRCEIKLLTLIWLITTDIFCYDKQRRQDLSTFIIVIIRKMLDLVEKLSFYAMQQSNHAFVSELKFDSKFANY